MLTIAPSSSACVSISLAIFTGDCTQETVSSSRTTKNSLVFVGGGHGVTAAHLCCECHLVAKDRLTVSGNTSRDKDSSDEHRAP